MKCGKFTGCSRVNQKRWLCDEKFLAALMKGQQQQEYKEDKEGRSSEWRAYLLYDNFFRKLFYYRLVVAPGQPEDQIEEHIF